MRNNGNLISPVIHNRELTDAEKIQRIRQLRQQQQHSGQQYDTNMTIQYSPTRIPVAQDTRSQQYMSKDQLFHMVRKTQHAFYSGSSNSTSDTNSDESSSDDSSASNRVRKMYAFLDNSTTQSHHIQHQIEGFESENDSDGVIGDENSADDDIFPDDTRKTTIATIETGLPLGNAGVDEAAQTAATERLKQRRETLQTVRKPAEATQPQILRDTPQTSRFNALIAETGEPGAANERDFLRAGTTLGGQAIVNRPLRLIQRFVEKLVMVDSAKRDARVWPNASEYAFDFAIPYKNVVQFQITQFSLLNTIPNFTTELQNITIPIQEYGRPVIFKTIEAGYYGNPIDLLTAIETKLNETPTFAYIPNGYPEYAAKLGVYYRPGSDYQRTDPITGTITNIFQFQDNINQIYTFDTSSTLISYYFPIMFDMIKQNIPIIGLTISERNRIEFFFEGLYDYVALDILLKYRQQLDEYRFQNTLDTALLNKYRLEFNPRTLKATIRAISLSDYILNLNSVYTNTLSPTDITTSDASFIELQTLQQIIPINTAIVQDMFFEFSRQWVRIFGQTIENIPQNYFTNTDTPAISIGVHHHLLHSDQINRLVTQYSSTNELFTNSDVSTNPALFFDRQYFPMRGIFDDIILSNQQAYHKLAFPLFPGDVQNFVNSYTGLRLTYDTDASHNFYNYLIDKFRITHDIDHTPFAQFVDQDGVIPINSLKQPYYNIDVFTIQSAKVAQPNELNAPLSLTNEIFNYVPATLSGGKYTTALITRGIRIEPFQSSVIEINSQTYSGIGLPPPDANRKYYLDIIYQHAFDPDFPLPDLINTDVYKLYTSSITFPQNEINMILYDSESKLIYDNEFQLYGRHEMKYATAWSTSKYIGNNYIETAIYNIPIESTKTYYVALALTDISQQLQIFSPINLANPAIHRWQGKIRFQFKPVIETKWDNVYPTYSNTSSLIYQPLSVVDISNHIRRIDICGTRDVDYYYNRMIDGMINFDQSGNRRFGYLNPQFNGIDTTIQIADLCAGIIKYTPFYELYIQQSELLQILQSTVNNRLFPTTGSPRNYINGLLAAFLPDIFTRRMNYLDPIPFRILFNTYSNPLVLEPNIVWGIGFNLGFPREDTIYALAHQSSEPVNTEQEYIYLAIDGVNNIDYIDKSVREFGDQILQFQFGQANSLYTKILLNNYSSYGSQLVANRTIFKPVLGRLKGIHVRLVDRNNRPINNESCDHHFTIKLTLTNTEIQPYDTLELSSAADEGKIEFQSSFM